MNGHNTPEAAASDGPKATSRAADQSNWGKVASSASPQFTDWPEWMQKAMATIPPNAPGVIRHPDNGKRYYVTEQRQVRRIRGVIRRPRAEDVVCADVHRMLGTSHPDDPTLRDALAAHPKYRRVLRKQRRDDPAFDPMKAMVRRYRDRYDDIPHAMDGLTPIIELAPAGTPWDNRSHFRSDWEERLSKALTRLGIGWRYESRKFDWIDGARTWHNYTPDFELTDVRNTFVEVKGPHGAAADDQFKMAQVLRSHPTLTLLLWDAETIEYVEDMESAEQVLALFTTTRLAA